MKNSLFGVLTAMFICFSAAHLDAGCVENDVTDEITLPSFFVIDRPFFKYFTSVKFISNGMLIASGKVDKLANSKKGFVVWDPAGRPLVSAALYTLLPSQDPLFVIRDTSEHVLGYLRVQDLSLFKLFKPVSTVLYSQVGDPMLKNVFWPCGFSFKTYDLRGEEKRPIIKAHKCWSGNLDISVDRPLNVDIPIILSMLQIQANRVVIENANDYLHTHASIHIDDLERYALASYAIVHPKEFILEAQPVQVDLSPWIKIKTVLGEPVVSLSDVEKTSIIESLAERFEDAEGEVDPRELLEALPLLTEEERAVLVELLSFKCPD